MKKVLYQTAITHPNYNGYADDWPRYLGFEVLARVQVTKERNCFLIWDSTKDGELGGIVHMVNWDSNAAIEWAVDYSRQRKAELNAKWEQERLEEAARIAAEEKATGQAA